VTTTSKAISPPVGDGTEVAAKYGRPDTGRPSRRIEDGHGMVRVTRTFEHRGRTYRAATAKREDRFCAGHPLALRRPELFELCSDDDASLAAEAFTEARARAGLGGSTASSRSDDEYIFGITDGQLVRHPRNVPMFGLID
jgi:hypothetical protein